MVRDQHLNTRISPEAYKKLLQKCANGGCTPYRYLRQLIHTDVGVDVDGVFLAEVQEEPVQTELKDENEHNNIEKRYRIVG